MAAWPVWVAALWWGSLTTLGFGVVPLLFAYLPTPALAGGVAAKLFTAQAGLSVLLGLALLMAARMPRHPAVAVRAQAALAFVLAGMLLALLVEFAVAPRIMARDNLRLWHAAGSAMLLLQWLCAGATFWHMVRPRAPDQV